MKNLSVRWKFTLLSGICLLTALSGVVGFSLYNSTQAQSLVREQTSSNLQQTAKDFVSVLASEQAQKVKAVLDKNYNRAEVLAQAVLFMRDNAINNGSAEQLRASVNQYIKQAVQQQTDVLGIYIVMERDAFGDADSLYINRDDLASNSVGRFVPYWARDNSGAIELEVMTEEDIADTTPEAFGLATNEWYACPIRTGKPCVLNPYLDYVGSEELLMTSVTMPLLVNGKPVGMLGIDLSLQSLQPLIEAVDKSFVDGQGQVLLLSQDGMVVAYDQNKAQLGKQVQELPLNEQADIENWLPQKHKRIEWSKDNQTLQALIPVPLSGNARPWGLVLRAPRDYILASAIELDKKVEQHNIEATLYELVGSLLIALVALVLVWLTSYFLVKPIWQVTGHLQNIASGEWDLTQRLKVESNDEVGNLVHWFNQFLDKLQTTVRHIGESVIRAQETSDRASEIAGRTSDSSKQQFMDVEQAATALEQMATTASLVAENAAKGVSSADAAQHAAVNGQQIAEVTNQAVDNLVNDVSAAMPLVDRLAKDSENIESILAVIQGIAEQTNLLALNAAIEAARAGEQGRGFAVVASEVRSLAERTQDSIGQIREVIEQIQSGTGEVVDAISSGNDKAIRAAEQVNEMTQALSVITEHIRNSSDMGEEIAKAAEEQSTVANEINLNVVNIKEASHIITQEAESSALLSTELQQLSKEQQQIVRQFKV